MEDERCGAETTSGDPCKNAAESCPWHNVEETPDGGPKPVIEKDPSIVELIAGQLQNGDTVPEACAEAGITEKTYYNYCDRGRENPDSIYGEFLQETVRARRIAGKRDRQKLKNKCREDGDTRTWYKIHLNQYGDSYGDEDTDMREGSQIILHESADTYQDAIQN